jgi:hypothetical protein
MYNLLIVVAGHLKDVYGVVQGHRSFSRSCKGTLGLFELLVILETFVFLCWLEITRYPVL